MEIQPVIVKNSYFIYKTWKEMWKQKCFLSGNSHNMIGLWLELALGVRGVKWTW
jgi:hypothetical protein